MFSVRVGKALSVPLNFNVYDELVVPDDGSVSFAVYDEEETELYTGTVAQGGNSINVPSAVHTDMGSDVYYLFLEMNFQVGGIEHDITLPYRVYIPQRLRVNTDTVRGLLGVTTEELPDSKIDLLDFYLDLKSQYTVTSQTKPKVETLAALYCAIDLVDTINLWLPQSYAVDEEKFTRYKVDFIALKDSLIGKVAVLEADLNGEDIGTPQLLGFAGRTDPFTGS